MIAKTKLNKKGQNQFDLRPYAFHQSWLIIKISGVSVTYLTALVSVRVARWPQRKKGGQQPGVRESNPKFRQSSLRRIKNLALFSPHRDLPTLELKTLQGLFLIYFHIISQTQTKLFFLFLTKVPGNMHVFYFILYLTIQNWWYYDKNDSFLYMLHRIVAKVWED